MNELVSFLRSLYQEGVRYDLLVRLSGTLAKMKVPLKEAITLYNFISDLDDEDRTQIIENAYERVEEGLPVLTLYSWKEIPKYKQLYDLLSKTYKSYKYLDTVIEDKDLKIREYKQVDEDIIDLNSISVKLNKVIHKEAYSYLQKRNIDDKSIEEFDIRVGVNNLLGYVVFPIFNKQDQCVYYVGRSYTKRKPRYKNPQKDKSRYIWNYYNPKTINSKTVVVYEGIINSITGYNYLNKIIPTVAVLGKSLSKQQIMLLQRFENIIFNFDEDVSFDYFKKKIYPFFKEKKVEYVFMPKDKDVNDMSKKEYQSYFFKRKILN